MQGAILLFPPENLSSVPAPMKEIASALEQRLTERGFQVTSGAALEPFLARHRVRYTGGVDAATAAQAKAELGAAAILVTSVTAFQASDPPRLSIELRLVGTGDDPRVLWAGGASHAGDEAPGLFDLGVVHEMAKLEDRTVTELANALARWSLDQGPRANACEGAGRFEPKVYFHSPALAAGKPQRIAVLPFNNQTRRRDAGAVVALQLLRQLQALPQVDVVEPGLVRDELLRFRIVLQGGVSLDTARIVTELVHADLALSGTVRTWDDPHGAPDAPDVQFTVMLLDRRNNEVLWQSTSYSKGDDGVFFFDLGTVSTASQLTCRMARSVIDGVTRGSPTKERTLR